MKLKHDSPSVYAAICSESIIVSCHALTSSAFDVLVMLICSPCELRSSHVSTIRLTLVDLQERRWEERWEERGKS